MKPLFWLCYHRDNRLLGVAIIEARELLEARMLAAIGGFDKLADFSEGYELSAQHAAMVSANLIGRMLSPAEAGRLMAWIESEAARKNMQTTQLDRMLLATGQSAHGGPARMRAFGAASSA
jgi:hypothetical protein